LAGAMYSLVGVEEPSEAAQPILRLRTG
jgi:hypothetical protein